MIDHTLRLRRLKIIQLQLANAQQQAFDMYGGISGSHEVCHVFENLTGLNVYHMLMNVDAVLIPNYERNDDWKVLIPYIALTMLPFRSLDYTPRFGCSLCR